MTRQPTSATAAETADDLRLLKRERLHPGLRAFVVEWLTRGYFRRPISPQRWHAIGDRLLLELRSRARAAKVDVETVLRLETGAAILLAVDEVPNGPEIVPEVRQRVQAIVTRALLGPGWREGWGEPGAAHEAEAADLDELLDLHAGLERLATEDPATAALLADLVAGLSVAEIAARWGWTKAAAKQRVHRARKKLSAGCHLLPVSGDIGSPETNRGKRT